MAASKRFIVSDTSILLAFVCANKQDLLIKFSGEDPIYVPSAVMGEMERKLREPRFQCGRQRWLRLVASDHFALLEENAGLLPLVRGFAGYGYTFQQGLAKNLGEFMCLAHCLQEKEKGRAVAMLADDGEARRIARKRLIKSFGSEDLLLRAVQLGLIDSRATARQTWEQLRKFDAHVPFEDTALNNPAIYSGSANGSAH